MSTSIPDLLTTDVLGYTCIPESSLDQAFTLVFSKGMRLPQTCLPDNATPSPELLASLLGRPASAEEWASFLYRWLRYFDPERALFVPIDPIPTTPVDLPLPVLLLALALCAIYLCKREVFKAWK